MTISCSNPRGELPLLPHPDIAEQRRVQEETTTTMTGLHRTHHHPHRSCILISSLGEEADEKEQEDKQQEEGDGECQEDDEKDRTKVSGKEYNFPKSLPEAPMAVQEARSGKEKQLPRAYANQKSVESLQRKNIVTPKVVMVAKCGGKSAFDQALCLVNLNVL